jgi:diadenosine tetraphosphate (Ap4A) HIT family hydrolase
MASLAFQPPTTSVVGCSLCAEVGGVLVAQAEHWRVVRVLDPNFPAYYRLIWRQHVTEFSQLDAPARTLCMEIVVHIETLLLEKLQPTKVNLASFGNVTPHVHWHIVARFEWDSHFPQPIWGSAQRELLLPCAQDRLHVNLSQLDSDLKGLLADL